MSSPSQLQLKARIVPTGQSLPWLQARDVVKDKGGLPSHPLLDDCLMRSEDCKSIRKAFPLWSSQVVVHPAVGGVFRRGESITDLQNGLIFPAEHIPEAAFDKLKIGLLVLPGELRETPGGMAIEQPVSILVVHGLVEQNGDCGRVHEESRLPLGVPPAEVQHLDWVRIRFLWRKETAGIGPARRGCNIFGGSDWLVVLLVDGPSGGFGVSSVAYDILDGTQKLAEGITLADIRRLATGATGNDLPEVLRALGSEQLDAVRRLAQTRPL